EGAVASQGNALAEQAAKLRQLVAEEQSLIAQINTMRQSEQALLKRVADADHDCHSLKQDLETLSAKAIAHAEEENQLRMQLVNFETAEEDQLKQIEKLKANTSAHEEAHRSTQAEIERLHEEEECCRHELAALRGQEVEGHGRLEEMHAELRTRTSEYDEASVQLNQAAQRATELRAEVKSLQEQLQQLSDDEALTLKEIQSVQTRVEDQEKAREDQAATLRHLTEQEQSLISQIQAMQETEERLSLRTAEAEADYDALIKAR